MLAHILGSPYTDDAMSHNELTTMHYNFQDFTCGSCGSGFVEELTEEIEPAAAAVDGDDSWDDDDYAMGDDQMPQVALILG